MNATDRHPRLEMLATSALRPNPRNARTHSDKQIAQIAASIRRFDWLVPIVADEANMIMAGHGRWLAAKSMKLSEVPVIRAAFLTEEDRRAFALAENKIAQLSGWDEKLLAEELTFLFEGGFELEITGFTTANLDFSLPVVKENQGSEFVELPDPNAQAISRLGDRWFVGPHCIGVADARDPRSYELLLDDERAAIVFGDLPYNVAIHGHVSGNGGIAIASL